MRVVDATEHGAIISAPWHPEIGSEHVLFFVEGDEVHTVWAKVEQYGERGFKVAFLDPSPQFLSAWARAVSETAKKPGSRPGRLYGRPVG